MIATEERDLRNLRKGGKILAGVLQELVGMVRPGITTAELDLAAEHAIRARGAIPAFLGYKPEGAAYPYPATLCVSINDEVVHGLPTKERLLREGDIASLDLGLSYEGLFVDSAVTVGVGACDAQGEKLISATREALKHAIAAAQPRGFIGDIGAAVEEVAHRYQFGIVQELGGHGLGAFVHEKPFVPNKGVRGEGEALLVGLVIAIEPMLCEGKGAIVLGEDQWTYRTRDHSRAAHFEHTVLITEGGPEVLTVL